MREENALTIVLGATDIEGDPLTYTLVTQPAHGTLTGTATSRSYTPNADFSGSDSFSFKANDGALDSNTATININVSNTNDAPVVADQRITTDQGIAVDVILSGTDVDADILSFVMVTQPSNGVISGNIPNLTYSSNDGFDGADSFTYKANDGELDSNTATVSLTIHNINDAPVAVAQSQSTDEDTALAIMLNVSDADNDSLTYSVETQPANGVLSGEAPELIYTPHNDFNGEDNFSYKANDGALDSDIVMVSIDVKSVNDTPLAVDDNLSLESWDPVEIEVLSNDIDVDGDPLIILGVAVDVGSVSISNNVLTYIPGNGFIGTVVIDYHISDDQQGEDTGQVFIEINVDDDSLPVISVPADIEVNADALSTRVDLGVATAVDQFGNSIAVRLLRGNTFFRPGVHTAIWQAADSEGRIAEKSQLVRVKPLLSIDKDQTVLEGFGVSVGVRLNGDSPQYPLTIGYRVSGTANEEDHELSDGVVTIESGTDGMIHFNILADVEFETDENIVITLDETLNRGSQFEHVITIVEENVDPQVSLTVNQLGEERFIVNQQDGIVRVTSEIIHPDLTNQFSFEWSNQQQLILDIDNDENSFSFDPIDLPVGIYHIALAVTDLDDVAFTDRNQVTIKIEQIPVTLSDNDSDNDGIPDNVEGQGDDDNDGIPDYLDNISQCNVLPENVNVTDSFLLEGDPGVCLQLGGSALTGSNGALIDDEQNMDLDSLNIGGVFDFIAYGLPVAGQSYQIVLPQIQPIPVNAIYRKLMPGVGWVNFVETGNDQIWSMQGESGHCQPPGDAAWQPGLVEGSWCVQLTIQDGGPNDADGEANSSIVDPGGVAVIVNNNQFPVASDDTAEARLNTLITLDVLLNDVDEDGDALSISSADASLGTVTIVDNQLAYQPAQQFFGVDTIIYGIQDGMGGTSSAKVSVTVLLNQNPVANADVGEVTDGQQIIINVLSNDTDPENDALMVIEASAEQGRVEINLDNTMTYTADSGFVGIDSISYRIQDALGGEANGQVNVNVLASVVTVSHKNSGGGALWWLLLMSFSVLAYRRVWMQAK